MIWYKKNLLINLKKKSLSERQRFINLEKKNLCLQTGKISEKCSSTLNYYVCLYWRPVLSGVIPSWKWLHRLRNTSRNLCLRTQFTVHKCRLKPCHAYVQMIYKHCSLLRWTDPKRKRVQWLDKSKLKILFGGKKKKMDTMSFKIKKRGIIWLVVSAQFKSQHLWWYGSLHMWKGTINTERYIKVLG